MKNIHVIKAGLQTDAFNRMRAGTKKMEFRLREGKWDTLRVGDIIEFDRREGTKKCPNNVLRVLVLAVVNYPSFLDLMKDLAPVIYNKKTKEEQLEGLRKFYTPEQERIHTVLGIKVRLCEEDTDV